MVTLKDLKKTAKFLGIRGYSRMKKSEIEHALLNHKQPPIKISKPSPLLKDKCSGSKILNPATNRCVSKTGRIGLKLSLPKPSQPLPKQLPKPLPKQLPKPLPKQLPKDRCEPSKIYREKTNRCVLRTGKIGKSLILQQKKIPEVKLISSVKQIRKPNSNQKRSLVKHLEKRYDLLNTTKPDFLKEVRKQKIKYEDINLPIGRRSYTSSSFRGNSLTEVAALLYLTHKFKNDCTIIPVLKPTLSTSVKDMFLHCSGLSGSQTLCDFSTPPDFWTLVKKCITSGKRFIVIPLSIVRSGNGHLNMLIYDSKMKSMERFEPHGSGSVFIDDNQLLSFLKEEASIFLPSLNNKKCSRSGTCFIKTYYAPLDYCPEKAHQYWDIVQKIDKTYNKPKIETQTESLGFCAAWSMWYADLRLSNPDVERSELVKQSIEAINNRFGLKSGFIHFIRSYSEFISNIMTTIRYSDNPNALVVEYMKRFNK
jgi:hypothetical protein